MGRDDRWDPGVAGERLISPAIDTAALLTSASELAAACDELPLTLELPGAAEARHRAGAARRQLLDYVVPRLRDLDAPALAVVGGSTGSGKSTLVNSLVGAEVSAPGVLRPTTRSPVLVHHPAAARWFTDARILGGLNRVRGGPSASPSDLELVANEAMPETIALLDAPDVDSVVDANRDLAAQLLDAADLWIFVTTAARYADAVPWWFLRSAVARGVHVAIVLNRVPPGAAGEVEDHLAEMLQSEGLTDSPLFAVDEQSLPHGRFPDAAIGPLRDWLDALASDQQRRTELVRRGLAGTVRELASTAERLAGAVEAQRQQVTWLQSRVDEEFDGVRTRITSDIRDGTVMRGEVLARWQELVGTGKLLEQLQSAIGRLRDRVAAAVTRRPPATERFQGAVSHGVEIVVRERVAQAIDAVAGAWRQHAAGASLLDASRQAGIDLERVGDGVEEHTARMVRDWQRSVLDLLRTEGAGKRRTAKALSYGVNGTAAVLMVGVFAQTGGLTGTEVAIAGGSSAVGQKVLEGVLGDQAVRDLTARARRDLDRRIEEQILSPEAGRFRAALEPHRTGDDADTLRDIGRRLLAAVAER